VNNYYFKKVNTGTVPVKEEEEEEKEEERKWSKDMAVVYMLLGILKLILALVVVHRIVFQRIQVL
jgi:hypothetical protein